MHPAPSPNGHSELWRRPPPLALPGVPPPLPRRLGLLSQREVEVLTLVATGAKAVEMASQLSLSEHTVRTHVKNIRRKLDARTCAQAVALACAYDMISPTPLSRYPGIRRSR